MEHPQAAYRHAHSNSFTPAESFAATSALPWKPEDFAFFLRQLPQLSGARNLMRHLDKITQQASLHVLTHCPEYAESVGEAGMKACSRDNRLTLMRAAQLLGGPNERPQEALLWWWDASVGGYLVHRAQEALEANVQGMYQALEQHLPRAEVQPIIELVNKMYQDALGVQLKVRSAVQLQTERLLLEGPRWQQLFAPSQAPAAAPPAALDWFSAVPADHALRMSSGVSSLPQAIQQTLQGVMPIKTRKILWTFIEAHLQQGDEEAAWAKTQKLIERSLRSQSCTQLLGEWRALLARLPQWMTPAASAYWTDTLLRGQDLIAQVSLGRTLQKEHKRLATDIAAHLLQQRVVARYSPKDSGSAPGSNRLDTAQQKCQRDLGLLFEAMGEILIQEPPSLAALNISRYLVQNIAPFVDYPGRVWRLVWLKLQDNLWSLLNAQEHSVLLLWVAQLQDVCADLYATRPLAEAVFHQSAPVFGDPEIAEQDWRNAIGGLLSAALTSTAAPYPCTVLAQRLLLSSPVFRNMDANRWQATHTALAESFADLLPAPLLEALQQVQANMSHSLLRLTMHDSLAGLHSEPGNQAQQLRFYLALPDLPYLAHSWQIQLWAKLSKQQQEGKSAVLMLNPADRLLAELNHWHLPTLAVLQARFERYASVVDVKQWLALPAEQNAAPREHASNATDAGISLADEYALNLRCLALYGQTPQLHSLLYSNYLFLEQSLAQAQRAAQASAQTPSALMESWFSALPSSHVLAESATQAQALLPKLSIARRLLNPGKDLSAELFPLLQVNPCMDFNFLLQQIGVYCSGLVPALDLARWYQENIAIFTSLRTRQRNAKLWGGLVKHLGASWSQAEQKILLEAVKTLARPYSTATQNDMPRLNVRQFDLRGALWRQVFQTAQPSSALQALQQVLPACSTQLSAAVYQGLEAFCQTWNDSGDVEAAWERLQAYWQTQLQHQSTAVLYRDWQAALPILAQHLNPLQEAYWLHSLHQGLTLLAQTGLGLRLQQQADEIARRIAQRLAQAPQGFSDFGLADPVLAAAKCRRDQALLLQAVGEYLSHQSPSLAALNIGRYLMQNIVPFVSYNTGVWQLVWLAWQDAAQEVLDPIEKQALRLWREQLSSLSPHITALYALDCFQPAGHANLRPEVQAQQHMRLDTLAGLLCAAATPDNAPIPGCYVLQRLVLSSPLFAGHTAVSWQEVQAELTQPLAVLDPSDLHQALQQRYSQIIDLLFKLPRLHEWQNFNGDEIKALLLSAAPAAELTWDLSQYAGSSQIQTASPSTLLVQQSNGWHGLQPQQAQQLAQTYKSIRQFDYHQTLSGGKWYQRNQPASLPAPAVPLLQTLLCNLSLYTQVRPSDNPIAAQQSVRYWLAQSWQALQELQPNMPKSSLLNFAQLWQQQQAQQPHLARLGELLQQQLAAVVAGHKLLTLNLDKYLAKATTHPRCATDARYLFKQMGAILCGEPQAYALEDWYAQHVGRYLKPATRPQELQFFNKLPKTWSDLFDAEEQAALAPLFVALLKHLAQAPPPTQIEWTVSR